MSKQYAQNDNGNNLIPEGDGVLGRVDGMDILTEAMKREKW